MKDQTGREISYMRVSVTDRCNLRCIYCMPEKGISCVTHEDILRFDEIKQICSAAAKLGISRIKLTGGEPLVRKGIPSLVEMLKNSPGIEQVTLTTNGTLLENQLNALVSAGLDAVNISIDTLDAQKYRNITRGGELKDALAGLETAVSCEKLEVRVNCVPLLDSDPIEYIRLAELAQKRKIDVRFIEMMPIGRGACYSGCSGEEIFSILTKEFGESESVPERIGNGPACYVRFHDFSGRIGFISAVSHKFCHQCNRIRLTSEGLLKPCLQYGTGIDLRALIRKQGDTCKNIEEQIVRALKEAIYSKPKGHCFEKGSRENDIAGDLLETKEMSQIGG